MRFIVDAMLGKLSLWLRLTGNDTFYSVNATDEELLANAKKENRILLTADRALFQRANSQGIQAMLVRGDVDIQIAKVFKAFKIAPIVNPATARCSKCNGSLIHLKGQEKNKIKHLVHEQTFNHYNEFWLCNSCQSVYFQGSYWDNIVKYMQRVQKLVTEMSDNS